MTSKAKSKQEEALQFLDDLDNLQPPAESQTHHQTVASRPSNQGNPADVLAFIDEITQKSSEPTRLTASQIDRPISRAGTPSLRKGTERVRLGVHSSPSTSSLASKPESVSGAVPATKPEVTATPSGTNSSGGWGWSNVWSSASAAYQQARSVVDEQVKNLPKNEQVSKWGEGVLEYAKTAQLDKLGQDFKRVGLSTLHDILNVVAPPISEHEVIQVWLSHDMHGYDGVETLVYRSLARIMEQVEGGDLIVNRGEESRPKELDSARDLNAVDGYEAALKLAQANLDEVMKREAKASKRESSVDNPVVYSTVYLRIQPFTRSYSLPRLDEAPSDTTDTHLQFILHLADPGHRLVRTTVTQAIPSGWLDVWDQYDWVEDLVAESLRNAVEVLGQDYLACRMGWGKKADITASSEEEAT